ncbi:serine hydrolase [Asanoa ishikariensis]|uniref:CubicO group peptidase, beta-lactamase class C family n=1 Tax=Asanoa ishikariensis TaxID=137265 RepID=A0A1H3RBD2_9ACTN|nr:serine hydrolase domain-containing protein [Asanoa ishikariensis]GIF64202.1 serine hydrolase [Asanoa ishikariensis]SDZ22950.1 CubicO group peptidase, beta-lactamase class C family [Asanoa ishikariensis]
MPDSQALALVESWPVDTVAVAVVNSGGVLARTGPEVELPWASVTKPLTALTVLAAIDDGLVSLDDPAGPPGSTVRHLLAHASGLNFGDDQVMGQPGQRRIYSNRGFEVLAEFVAERAEGSFADLMIDLVLDQLDMADTVLEGSPAAKVTGPVGDLATLARELLAPTIAPALTREAAKVAFPGLSGVLPGYGRQDPNDWGLGFEIRSHKTPHWTGANNSPATFGHFGQTGTFLWVDPVAGLACACLTDRNFGEWAHPLWPALSDAVLAEFGQP